MGAWAMRAGRDASGDAGGDAILTGQPGQVSQDGLARSATEAGAHGYSAADLRAANRACILAALERDGPLSRIALARRLGLSRTTVSHIIAVLLAEGRVREDGALPASEAGGRRATLLWVRHADG